MLTVFIGVDAEGRCVQASPKNVEHIDWMRPEEVDAAFVIKQMDDSLDNRRYSEDNVTMVWPNAEVKMTYGEWLIALQRGEQYTCEEWQMLKIAGLTNG